MTLENQVVSLELSKRLKELGVKQKSLFYWCEDGFISYVDTINYLEEDAGGKRQIGLFCAFTVAELGEMLPKHTMQKSIDIPGEWVGWIMTNPNNDRIFRDRSQADATAKMLIYLLENKLIEL